MLSRPVTLPLWMVLSLAMLAAWALVFRILLPLGRWLAQRPIRHAVEEWNQKLRIRLQPFKLIRRRVLLDRLLYDAQVQAAIEEHAAETKTERAAVEKRVKGYVHEIVPAFNAYFYFRIGYRVARAVARRLYRVRLGSSDEAALAAVPADATVVFVMNHRSNMDYILVSYLVAEKAALSYAVGEWARVWPLQQLIRSMGAYFVRRNSKDPLYRRVLERYVAMATEAGVTQAMFPEGGLTRDGALREPKLGLLDYMLRGFSPQRVEHGEARDVVFVPVALNYDRVLEDRTLLIDLLPREERKRAPALVTTVRFVARNLALMLKSEWHRFGYACVNFGRPVSAARFFTERGLDPHRLDREARFEAISALARELMHEIGRAVPVLPVPVVARVLLGAGEGGLSEIEIKSRFLALVSRLESAGARIYVPRQDQDYSASVGLRMLTLRRLVEEEEGLFRPRADERSVLEYYANSLQHLLPSTSDPILPDARTLG